MTECSETLFPFEAQEAREIFTNLYHGRYAEAKKKFKACLLILQNQQAPLSVARVHLWLAMIAEGEGDRRSEMQELDAAMRNFTAIGPKVVFGS